MARKKSVIRHPRRRFAHAAESTEYRTPRKLRHAITKIWGWPSVDVCADDHNCFAAEGKHINVFMNGLEMDWYEDSAYGHNRYYAYCYPPPVELELWLDKAREQQDKNCATLMLVEFRALTLAMNDALDYVDLIMLRPRIRPEVAPGAMPVTQYRQYVLLNFLPEYRAMPSPRFHVLAWKNFAKQKGKSHERSGFSNDHRVEGDEVPLEEDGPTELDGAGEEDTEEEELDEEV